MVEEFENKFTITFLDGDLVQGEILIQFVMPAGWCCLLLLAHLALLAGPLLRHCRLLFGDLGRSLRMLDVSRSHANLCHRFDVRDRDTHAEIRIFRHHRHQCDWRTARLQPGTFIETTQRASSPVTVAESASVSADRTITDSVHSQRSGEAQVGPAAIVLLCRPGSIPIAGCHVSHACSCGVQAPFHVGCFDRWTFS